VSHLAIEPFTSEMTPEAARMLARAFVTNPLHVSAFGASQLAKNEAFFRTGLAAMKGTKLVALDGSRIVGLVHWVGSPGCQFSGVEKLRMMPAMLSGFGLRSAGRVGSWLGAWAKHDPAGPHVHLGPIGVAPDAQGRHIGHRLMERYCEAQDRSQASGYLETDRPENVDFYARFGFAVSDQESVLGVTNYFMRRNVSADSPR
jgi:GNAT superfamily N-acetyltransferase